MNIPLLYYDSDSECSFYSFASDVYYNINNDDSVNSDDEGIDTEFKLVVDTEINKEDITDTTEDVSPTSVVFIDNNMICSECNNECKDPYEFSHYNNTTLNICKHCYNLIDSKLQKFVFFEEKINGVETEFRYLISN